MSDDGRVLAALEVLGWPDDRKRSAHIEEGGYEVVPAGHYWALVCDVLNAADLAAGLERSDLPEGQQSKDLAAIVAEVMHRALDAVDENWHLSCMEPDGDGSCAKGHYARLMLAEDVAPKVIEAVEARVRADIAEEIARARAQALMDARDDLARTAERLERKGREPGGRQQLGTAAGVRLACFRLIELADAAQKDAGKGFPSSPAALPDQAGTREHPEDRDAR